MMNEEFQKLVLEKLSSLENSINYVKTQQEEMKVRQDEMKVLQDEMKVQQDEIYQVVKAIEHSNQVGKADLDRHDFRIAKVEGKLKKAGKVFSESLDDASNL